MKISNIKKNNFSEKNWVFSKLHFCNHTKSWCDFVQYFNECYCCMDWNNNCEMYHMVGFLFYEHELGLFVDS